MGRLAQLLNQIVQSIHVLFLNGAIALEPLVQMAKPIPAQPEKDAGWRGFTSTSRAAFSSRRCFDASG